MNLQLGKGPNFTYDHSDSLVMEVEPVIIQRVHSFLRHEPSRGNPVRSSNIHVNYVLWICLKGRGSLMVDGITYVFNEDDAIITFPGQQHIRVAMDSCRVDWLLIRFAAICPKWFNMFRSRMMHMSESSIEILRRFSHSFLDASKSLTPNAGLESSCHLGLLLNSLRSDTVPDEHASQLAFEGNDYVRQACQLIISPEFMGKSFRVIAKEIGISPAYLRELFKKQIGATTTDIITRNKSHAMQHLLLNSTLTITQIAEKCGFDSVYSFSRFFRHKIGMSPMQFRKQNRHSPNYK